jgi:oligopeptide/dipeptide ABC transporter ATP-binding protein
VEEVLEVRNLEIEYNVHAKVTKAVRGVGFEVRKGEVLGLMGESGAGKSTVGWAIMRMIDPPNVATGEILSHGKNVLSMTEAELAEYRWERVTMIFQTAMNSLDPIARVDKILMRLLLDKKAVSNKTDARARVGELLGLMGLPASVAEMYPFELSGGMKQRIQIAAAIATQPELLIADEPTTALDTITQFSILDLLTQLRTQGRLGSVLFISHDLSVQAFIADRVAVMLKGKIVEVGSNREIFKKPLHPYTQFLMSSLTFNNIESPRVDGPKLNAQPSGCPFAELCPKVMQRCREEFPHETKLTDSHLVWCFLYGE